jgi:mannose-1-phosphate guanylyltransferase
MAARPASCEPAALLGRRQLWGIVLAGGDGVRLRSLARRVCGDERPKQYVPVLGERTLLAQTLDRVAREIPPSRIAVVTLHSHARYFSDRWGSSEPPAVLVQPAARGTAAGILLPVHWVFRQDPDATVAIFPSDHFVSSDAQFMTEVARIAAWADAHPDRIVLLGARPTGAEAEYGWIERGRPLDGPGERATWEVRRFWEKPSAEQARACLDAGCLWNTFVLIGKAAAFLRAGREAVPAVDERLTRVEPFFGTEDEAGALHQAYVLMPTANFSRSILEPSVSLLAVAELSADVIWSDLGSPRRVFDILRRSPCLPPWALPSDLAAS